MNSLIRPNSSSSSSSSFIVLLLAVAVVVALCCLSQAVHAGTPVFEYLDYLLAETNANDLHHGVKKSNSAVFYVSSSCTLSGCGDNYPVLELQLSSFTFKTYASQPVSVQGPLPSVSTDAMLLLPGESKMLILGNPSQCKVQQFDTAPLAADGNVVRTWSSTAAPCNTVVAGSTRIYTFAESNSDLMKWTGSPPLSSTATFTAVGIGCNSNVGTNREWKSCVNADWAGIRVVCMNGGSAETKVGVFTTGGLISCDIINGYNSVRKIVLDPEQNSLVLAVTATVPGKIFEVDHTNVKQPTVFGSGAAGEDNFQSLVFGPALYGHVYVACNMAPDAWVVKFLRSDLSRLGAVRQPGGQFDNFKTLFYYRSGSDDFLIASTGTSPSKIVRFNISDPDPPTSAPATLDKFVVRHSQADLSINQVIGIAAQEGVGVFVASFSKNAEFIKLRDTDITVQLGSESTFGMGCIVKNGIVFGGGGLPSNNVAITLNGDSMTYAGAGLSCAVAGAGTQRRKTFSTTNALNAGASDTGLNDYVNVFEYREPMTHEPKGKMVVYSVGRKRPELCDPLSLGAVSCNTFGTGSGSWPGFAMCQASAGTKNWAVAATFGSNDLSTWDMDTSQRVVSTLDAAENNMFTCSCIEETNTGSPSALCYFGQLAANARITQVRVTDGGLVRLGHKEPGIDNILMSSQWRNHYIFFTSRGATPGVLTKLQARSFEVMSSLTLNVGENVPEAITIVNYKSQGSWNLFVGCFTTPGKLIRFTMNYPQTATLSRSRTRSDRETKSVVKSISKSVSHPLTETDKLTASKEITLSKHATASKELTLSKPRTITPMPVTTATNATTTTTAATNATTTAAATTTITTAAATTTTTTTAASTSSAANATATTTADPNATTAAGGGPATTTTTTAATPPPSTTTSTPSPPTTSTTTTTTTTTIGTTPPPATEVTFAPLPSEVVELTTVAAPTAGALKEIQQQQNLEEVGNLLLNSATTIATTTNANGATDPPTAEVIPSAKLYVPYSGLGTFVKKPGCGAKATVDISTSGDSATITATAGGTAADIKLAMDTCVAFNPSQATLDRNLTAKKILGVEVTAGAESAVTALQLNKIVFNNGPQTLFAAATNNCSRDVPRGARFSVDLGYVFTHSLGLPMQIQSASSDGFPLPTTVRVSANLSGYVNIRGTISDDTPLRLTFTATDTFKVVHANCRVTPIFVNLRLASPLTEPYQVHVGAPFVISVPYNTFESSSPYSIVSILQPGRFPLPIGVQYNPPGTLLGVMPAVGFFNWTLTAADPFNEAYGYILINSTNEAPQVSVKQPYHIGRVFAARAMTIEIPLQQLFNDPEDDPLSYSVNPSQLASIGWIKALVTPGIKTRAPQSLTLSGDVPKSARGKNISLSISCTDGFNESWVHGILSVALGAAPIQVKELPQYITEPGKAVTGQISIGDYFVSPDGDDMIASYSLEPPVTWATVSITPGKDGTPPVIAITANRDKVEDTHVDIVVTVANALGDNVTATSRITIARSDWQKMRQIATTLGAAIGIVTSLLGAFVYWPHLVNLFYGRRLVIDCPLHWQRSPVYKFPKGIKVFDCKMRSKFLICKKDLLSVIGCFSHYIWNLVTLKPTPHGRPPVYLASSEKALKLVVPKPEDGQLEQVTCRLYAAKNFLKVEFEVIRDECYEGYDEAAPTAVGAAAGAGAGGGFGGGVAIDPELAASVTNVANKHKTLELDLFETGAKTESEMQDMKEKFKRQEEKVRSMEEIINRLVNGGGGAGALNSVDAASRSNPFSPGGSPRNGGGGGSSNLHFTQSTALTADESMML